MGCVELEDTKTIVSLVSRLQLLCEGFDDTNKSAIISSKFKVLLELSKKSYLSPAEIKQNLGLAKSNVAGLCNKMAEDGEIEKIKDKFDSRSIYYALTSAGKQKLETMLAQMDKNIKGQLAYKNNFAKIAKTSRELFELVK